MSCVNDIFTFFSIQSDPVRWSKRRWDCLDARGRGRSMFPATFSGHCSKKLNRFNLLLCKTKYFYLLMYYINIDNLCKVSYMILFKRSMFVYCLYFSLIKLTFITQFEITPFYLLEFVKTEFVVSGISRLFY